MSLMTLETPSRERVPVKSCAHLPLSLLPRCSHPFPPIYPKSWPTSFFHPSHPSALGSWGSRGQLVTPWKPSDSRGVRGALQNQRSGGN